MCWARRRCGADVGRTWAKIENAGNFRRQKQLALGWLPESQLCYGGALDSSVGSDFLLLFAGPLQASSRRPSEKARLAFPGKI